MRILSWNLLKKKGAQVEDIGLLVAKHRPDLVLMQEATASIDALPGLLGGHYVRKVMAQRDHGMAAWSARPFTITVVDLPVATRFDLPVPVFRLVAPRLALVVQLDGMEIANMHLDHGQRVNRRQIAQVLESCPPSDAVIGDYNALGRTSLPGFRDVGPRCATHWAYHLVPLRIDRCLVRNLRVVSAVALDRGASDHRPILMELVRDADGSRA
jgi:endonuclease/exonuclease/phosphatase family metal-dependent hydrolase